MRVAGILPVITHPERNQLLQQRLPALERWVQEGCYLQVTGQSLVGRFGKTARAFSIELLKRNLVHFIASDGFVQPQRDTTGVLDFLPLTEWPTDQVIGDLHCMALPAGLAPGSYSVQAGLYDPATGQRHVIADGAAAAPQDAVPLTEITWQP